MEKGHLVIDNVTKIFPRTDMDGTTTALSDVSMNIKPGEFICIVGASGCGKSTLLRLIAGLENPTKGKLMLDDEEIKGASPNRGLVFQDPTLFPWRTVWENVAFGPKMQGTYEQRKEDIKKLIHMVGLDGFENSYPHQLSGGMAQRVALIRTMVNQPAIWLLDEPLGALDAFTRMNMQDELIRIWEQNNNTMIMITHDVDEAIYLGTQVVVMSPRPGRIREVMPIEMPYPRNRASSQFTELRSKILEMLDFAWEEQA